MKLSKSAIGLAIYAVCAVEQVTFQYVFSSCDDMPEESPHPVQTVETVRQAVSGTASAASGVIVISGTTFRIL